MAMYRYWLPCFYRPLTVLKTGSIMRSYQRPVQKYSHWRVAEAPPFRRAK